MNRPSVASCPVPVALPVIFVPGIMGSRLRNKNGELVWLPESMAMQLWDKGFSDAREKRLALVQEPENNYYSSDYLSVHPGTVGGVFTEERISRGWGGVLWGFYGSFLSWLEHTAKFDSSKLPRGCHSVNYEVWAYPYNWTDDNKNSAKGQEKPKGVGSDVGLKKIIETAISETTEKYKDQDVRILKPVLITHSMGGLVGRAFCKLLGGEDMLHGVIHGAMPTDGVPATYKRMLAGAEGAAALVLGWDQTETTATAGNMPGALQLLPNKRHKGVDGSSNWLRVNTRQRVMLESLPRTDPYAEIYRNQSDWWRLIDPELLNPDGDTDDAYKDYLTQLDKAEAFHDSLGSNGFHPNTRMFYSEDEGHLAWDHIDWILNQRAPEISEGLKPSSDGLGTVSFLNYNAPKVQGKLSVEYEHSFTIRGPNAPGDGTVHAGSGKYVPVMSVPTSSGFEHAAAFDSLAARRLVADWLVEMVNEQL